MPTCPMCNKPLREMMRRCPSCQADLDLLVDYTSHLQGGLEKADNLTRAGEFGQAVFAYLEVLDVDPGNAVARRQVTQVVSAVRNFDQASHTMRLLKGQIGPGGKVTVPFWNLQRLLMVALVALVAFSMGFVVGNMGGGGTEEGPPPVNQPKDAIGG